MIIHHKDEFNKYKLTFLKKLKYSDSFSFVPIKVYNSEDEKYNNCIFQTPYLFSPYGIQRTNKDKEIIDLSFFNKENDSNCFNFINTLENIYKEIQEKYKKEYNVNNFLKNTNYNECMRLKISPECLLFDTEKNKIKKIDSFSYGIFLIELHGIWITDNEIWIQWYLLQGKIIKPIEINDFLIIEDKEINNNKELDKYDKMIKMGVPKDAVERQKNIDLGIKNKTSNVPPPPPLPNMLKESKESKESKISKIKAEDLKNIKLKKPKPLKEKIIIKNEKNFEPPTLEELQTTLSRLKKIK